MSLDQRDAVECALEPLLVLGLRVRLWEDCYSCASILFLVLKFSAVNGLRQALPLLRLYLADRVSIPGCRVHQAESRRCRPGIGLPIHTVFHCIMKLARQHNKQAQGKVAPMLTRYLFYNFLQTEISGSIPIHLQIDCP